MKYASIKKHDVANGPGVRVSIFVSGCNHKCNGCFNEEAWDFQYGTEYLEETTKEILEALDKKHIEGLSLLGGEPLEYANQKCVATLVKAVREKFPEKTIWCYTGFMYNKDVMDKMYPKWIETRNIIDNIDVIVDGKFEIDNLDLSLRFKGSSNQRIIDVKKSLLEKKVIHFEFMED